MAYYANSSSGGGGDEFPAIVGEVGHYSTKMGYAGDDFPRAYFRSTTAVKERQRRKHDFLTAPFPAEEEWQIVNPVEKAATGLIYYGAAATSLNANDSDATERSEEEDCYDTLSSYIRHGCSSALGLPPDNPASTAYPLLLLERSYNPPPIRQRLLQLLFEDHALPATFLARDAVCACYAVGRTTATVVDIGHVGTVVSPVYEGYVEGRGILRNSIGGSSMQHTILDTILDPLYLQHNTQQQQQPSDNRPDYVMPLYQTRMSNYSKRNNQHIHQLARLDMARLCFEDGSGACVGPMMGSLPNEDQQFSPAPKTLYALPDGTTILDIPLKARLDVGEIFFGKDVNSIAKREEGANKMQQSLNDLLASLSTTTTTNTNNGDMQMDDDGGVLKPTRYRRAVVKEKKNTFYSKEKLKMACAPYLSNAIGEITSSTLSTMVCDAVYKCDRDQQAQLLGNVVLCGGGACLSSSTTTRHGDAMPDRLREELEAMIHTHTPGWRVKVLSPAMTERSICSWLGGSILATLGGFHDMWITKAEYEEHGPSIVHRKCP